MGAFVQFNHSRDKGMKIHAIVGSFLASVLSAQLVLADESDCFKITGDIQIFPSDEGTCPLVMENGDRFDVNFLFNTFNNTEGFPTCFSGQLANASILIGETEIPVEGSSESALTEDFLSQPSYEPFAASAIRINSPKLFKGSIFTLDYFSASGETLVVSSGNRAYKEVDAGSSIIEITGDATSGQVPFDGWICL